MMDRLDRLPPHSRECERALLGCILRDSQTLPEIVGLVKADDFYLFAHKLIFEAMAALGDKGKEVDIVTIAEWLTKHGKLDDAGGYPLIAELFDAAPSAGHYRHYSEVIREKAMARRLIAAAAEIGQDAFDPITPSKELLASAEQKVLEIAEMGATGEAVHIDQALRETYDRLEARLTQDGQKLPGVMTGFIDLDRLLAGLQNSELIILAARTSVGKTAFAVNIARNVALIEKLPVLFVSLEQSRMELSERLLCIESRVSSHRLRMGYLKPDEQEKLMDAGARLSGSKLFLDDTPGQNMLRIGAVARRLKRRDGIRLVIVDYLQLIDPENRREPRQEQVAAISRRLKHLARELKIPVIALAQLNRGVENRSDSRPRLADLRESGSIEQDADTVMMLHRPEEETGAVEVIVGKQRNGPTGDVKLMFVKDFMRFENYAVEQRP